MKALTSLLSAFVLSAFVLSAVALAEQPQTASDFNELPAASVKRLSGSATVGYDTLGSGRGIILSHSVVGGDGSPFAAVKLNYDFGKKGAWSWDTTLGYRDSVSGHRLYGNPNFGEGFATASVHQRYPMLPTDSTQFKDAVNRMTHTAIKQANCDPEWAMINGLRYTQEKWNVGFGHDVIRGGVIGVMAKHFRHQGASCVNEFYVRPELTPYKWVSAGVVLRYSVAGIDGWWFEPDITFKAPLIGTADDVKLAAVLKLCMSATANYFNHTDSACGNGSQAYWAKLYFPYYVTKQFSVTPGIGLHWLGRGAVKCNEKSSYRTYTGNPEFVPFRNFAVVGTIMCTYHF